MLKPYGIRPRGLRIDDRTPKKYRAADFADAWTRYLDAPASEVSARDPQHDPNPQHEIARKQRDVADVADVAANTNIGETGGQATLTWGAG